MLTDPIDLRLRGTAFRLFCSNKIPVRQMKLRLLALLVLLTIVDGLQTMSVVGQHGVNAEINPFMRLVLEELTGYGMWMLKALSVFAVLVAMKRVRIKVLILAVLLMACVVTSNLVQMVLAQSVAV